MDVPFTLLCATLPLVAPFPLRLCYYVVCPVGDVDSPGGLNWLIAVDCVGIQFTIYSGCAVFRCLTTGGPLVHIVRYSLRRDCIARLPFALPRLCHIQFSPTGYMYSRFTLSCTLLLFDSLLRLRVWSLGNLPRRGIIALFPVGLR